MFAPVGDLLHADSPVVEFDLGAGVGGFLLGLAVIVQQVADDLKPLGELSLEIMQFLHVLTLLVQTGVVFGVQLEQFLSRGHALDGVGHFTGELAHKGEEFFPDLGLALTPVLGTHAMEHRVVSVGHHLVKLD